MKLILLSDIHGNLLALKSVIDDFVNKYNPEGIMLLGDIINYGMQPNEVIEVIKRLEIPIIANIFGNHEKALFDEDTSHFSTERGKRLLEYTHSIINSESIKYLRGNCNPFGYQELRFEGKRTLAIHGSLSDAYWGKLNAETIDERDYADYDYVVSGHSHIPHFIEKFYEYERPEYRNKKRIIFINPGSVGQPRNHNSKAQYAYFDTQNEIIHFNSVKYDIEKEQSLYPDFLDRFYSNRLSNGI